MSAHRYENPLKVKLAQGAAVLGMSVGDGFAILKGGDQAATTYLRDKTTASLTERFRPIVEQATQKVALTSYWTPLVKGYNKAGMLTGSSSGSSNGRLGADESLGLRASVEIPPHPGPGLQRSRAQMCGTPHQFWKRESRRGRHGSPDD